MSSSEPTPTRRSAPPENQIDLSWRADRTYLIATALHILGDLSEAEDAVAEGYARLSAQPVETLQSVRGWLVVVVRRICLDRLRSGHHRLSVPTDPSETLFEHDPTRAGTATPDLSDRVTLDEEIVQALAVVLDRLTPGERAAFLLHDVFGLPFDRIATLVGRSPVASRQLATRARRAIRAVGPIQGADSVSADPRLDRVAEGFAMACTTGDVDALAALLHDDVLGWAVRDGAVLSQAHGAREVSVQAIAFFGSRSPWQMLPLPLDDSAGVLVLRHGAPAGMIRLATDDDGLITGVFGTLLAVSNY